MELKFIWISNYRIIENLGFNFHHSDIHKFQYSDNNILLSPNPKSPIDFGENITGVTAIAGENGSGKSSLCEAVLMSTATYANGRFGYSQEFKGIVCFGDHIFVHDSLKVNNKEDLVNAGYTIEVFKESPFERMKHEWRSTFVKGGFIYYSNVLDYRADIEEANLANISTMSALPRSRFYSSSFPLTPLYDEDRDRRDKDKHSLLQIHYNVEGNRIVKYYVQFYSLVSFISPTEFVLKLTYSGNNRWLDLNPIFKYYQGHDFSAKVNGLKTLESQILDGVFNNSQQYNQETIIKINPDEFKQAIKRLYRFNLFIASSILENKIPDIAILNQFVFSPEGQKNNKPELDELVKLHSSIVDRSLVLERDEYRPASLSRYFKGTQDWRFYLIENYYLKNNDDNLILLKRFMYLEESLLRRDSVFRRITNFNLTPLSSGENSFLTFFSRIHDVMDRYNAGVDFKNKLILFIDEAEVGFHPAWKRIYLKKLLDFLNNYAANYKFQIILTTHSPYLLSDLPSDNVILLKKGVNGRTTLLDSNSYKTFGSNIHELLGTSFFLHEGFMGEFAKQKIEEIVGFFQGKNNNYDKESAKELISLIGDEVISSRLTDMYNEMFGDFLPREEKEYEEWLVAELKRVKLKAQ